MRKLLAMIILASLVISSCKKELPKPPKAKHEGTENAPVPRTK